MDGWCDTSVVSAKGATTPCSVNLSLGTRVIIPKSLFDYDLRTCFGQISIDHQLRVDLPRCDARVDGVRAQHSLPPHVASHWCPFFTQAIMGWAVTILHQNDIHVLDGGTALQILLITSDQHLLAHKRLELLDNPRTYIIVSISVDHDAVVITYAYE